MATATITNTIKDGSGTAISGVTVVARLMPGPGFRTSDAHEIVNVTTTTNGSGAWSLALEKNADMTPANTYWQIEEQVPEANGGPRTWAVTVTASMSLYAAAQAFLLPAATNPTALTTVAGDARYQLIPATGDAVRYVSASGDDNNDGLTWGKAKATIAAAITSLPNTGGHIRVGAGTFTTSATITSTLSSLRITGSGVATNIRAANALNANLMDLRGDGIIVEHLVLNGNKANQTAGDYCCLQLTNATNALVFDVVTHDGTSHGIYVNNTGGAWAEVRIQSCFAYNNGSGGSHSGILCIGGNRAIIAGCVSELNGGDGLYLQSVTNATVTDNVFQQNTGYGIELLTTITTCTFTGNVCLANHESGIGADGIVSMTGNVFSSNTCSDNGGAGIQLQSGSGNPAYNLIIGNTCRRNSQPGLARDPSGTTTTNTRDGIELSGSTKALVSGNYCYDDQGSPTQRRPFSDGGGSGNNLVTGNYFAPGATGGAQFTSTAQAVGFNYDGSAFQVGPGPLVVTDVLALKTKAGAPVDGDFWQTPPNGTVAVDTTNSKIYVRIGGTWKSVTVA